MVERKAYLAQLRSWKKHRVIKVITAVRRCGKSTLLELFRNELQAEGVCAKKIPDHYPKYVLTMDDLPMGEDGMKQVNIIDFLLAC